MNSFTELFMYSLLFSILANTEESKKWGTFYNIIAIVSALVALALVFVGGDK